MPLEIYGDGLVGARRDAPWARAASLRILGNGCRVGNAKVEISANLTTHTAACKPVVINWNASCRCAPYRAVARIAKIDVSGPDARQTIGESRRNLIQLGADQHTATAR